MYPAFVLFICMSYKVGRYLCTYVILQCTSISICIPLHKCKHAAVVTSCLKYIIRNFFTMLVKIFVLGLPIFTHQIYENAYIYHWHIKTFYTPTMLPCIIINYIVVDMHLANLIQKSLGYTNGVWFENILMFPCFKTVLILFWFMIT